MALNIDTSRALRSPTQLIDLVQAVIAADAADEKHWLEWKLDADLTAREWQAKCAKFILGAANRELDRAASVVGGCAYLVLGAEPGRLQATAMPDPATLDASLRRYLGTEGPLY